MRHKKRVLCEMRMSDTNEKNDKRPSKDESVSTAGFGDSVGASKSQIGPYKLLSVLGEGGYGIVYLAEQQSPVRRRVALKRAAPECHSCIHSDVNLPD